MSFGKDPEQLGRVVPYGGNLGDISQRSRHLSKSRENVRNSRGSGGAPYWKDTFKVPQDHARFGRLIAGHYVQQVSFDNKNIVEVPYEYFMFKEHFHGATERGAICSAGPLFSNRNMRQPCDGCDMFWEDVAARSEKKKRGDKSKGPNRMSARDMYALTWWDYGLFYKVQATKNDGTPITTQSGEGVYNWVMGREHDPRYANCERKYGHLLAWPMGETYKNTLLTQNDYIREDCRNCSSRGSIQFISKNCQHCNAVVYDANTTLSPEQRTQIDSEPHRCVTCGNVGFLTEMINCIGCGNGSRASIFDVDLQLTAQGSNGQQTFLQILNRSEPRVIQVADPEVLKTIAPMDLPKKFSPTPLDKQREIWKTGGATPQQQPQQFAQPGAPPMMPGMPHAPGFMQPQQPQWQHPVAPGFPPGMVPPPAVPQGYPGYPPQQAQPQYPGYPPQQPQAPVIPAAVPYSSGNNNNE